MSVRLVDAEQTNGFGCYIGYQLQNQIGAKPLSVTFFFLEITKKHQITVAEHMVHCRDTVAQRSWCTIEIWFEVILEWNLDSIF
jgi:hypothetical protein